MLKKELLEKNLDLDIIDGSIELFLIVRVRFTGDEKTPLNCSEIFDEFKQFIPTIGKYGKGVFKDLPKENVFEIAFVTSELQKGFAYLKHLGL